jgi:hypothetical protein
MTAGQITIPSEMPDDMLDALMAFFAPAEAT